MRKNCLLLLCTFFIALTAGAQEKRILFDHSDRSNYLLSGGYGEIQKTLDKGVSPLLYEGLGFGGNVGYRSEKSNRIWQLSGSIGMSNQYTSATRSDMGFFTSYNIDIQGRYLWNTLPPEKDFPVDIYAGLNLMQNMRFRRNDQMYNATFGYDLISGTGLSAHFSKTVKINGFNINLWRWQLAYKPHRITFDYEFDLPLMFLYLRPTYVIIENFVDGRTDPYDTERTESASIGEVVYFNSNLGFSYHLRNKNIIRLAYIWQYYKIDQEYNPVQGARHLLQLIFKFKLNQSENESI